ncbi:MAG: magnesium/cobalt transporter CorA [Armatimonadota bacterium]
MLELRVLKPGNGFIREENLERIDKLVADSSKTVWLDALDPTHDELDLLAREFGFHPLAIDDYLTPHQRPKVDEYEGYFFIVIHSVEYSPEEGEVTPIELALFVGKNYIVTLHGKPLPMLSRIEGIWEKEPREVEHGIGLLLYDILDALVDSYFPVLDQIDDQIDGIEDEIFGQKSGASIESTFRLKRSLVLLRRIAAPLRDVFNVLTRRDQPLLSEHAITYLRDIYDHTLRILDTIDTYRDILTGALDAYLSIISNQLNGVMKTLTVVATILISAQVITGIYGMNFKYMPELKWVYGYPAALAGMAVMVLGLLYYFKRIKWL